MSNLIYRNPALLARQAAAVDVISGGRLILGIGAGVYESDHAMAGVPMWSPRERVDRLQEALDILDSLLRGQVVTSSGSYYAIKDAIVRPSPRQVPRPPILVGALGPKMIALAVREAEIWNTWGGFHSEEPDAIESIRRQCQQVSAECERNGRDPLTLRRSICLYPPFDPWSSERELERLVSIFSPWGITEYVVYAPPQDKEDLMIRAVAALAD